MIKVSSYEYTHHCYHISSSQLTLSLLTSQLCLLFLFSLSSYPADLRGEERRDFAENINGSNDTQEGASERKREREREYTITSITDDPDIGNLSPLLSWKFMLLSSLFSFSPPFDLRWLHWPFSHPVFASLSLFLSSGLSLTLCVVATSFCICYARCFFFTFLPHCKVISRSLSLKG